LQRLSYPKQKQQFYNFDKMETLGTKNVLTFNEACMFSGLSKSHMYRLTSTRQVPHFKPFGKMVYFERAELEKWLLQNRVVTMAETETMAANYCKTGKGLR
jgi:excisionase family DNA binding protein